MKASSAAMLLLLSVAAGTGCGSKVLVPPRYDLAELFRVGMITFTVENAKGELHTVATEYFTEEVLNSGQGIEVLELGETDQVLEQIGRERMDLRALQAVGEEYGVPAVFLGNMDVSRVTPRASIRRFPSLEATVSVQMTVRLVSTETGGTMWRSSARATESVGGLAFVADEIIFSAEDPKEAYGHLVEHLVFELTRDFRPTYR